jgi:Zn-dependent M28 family amino/carboxypeptidase
MAPVWRGAARAAAAAFLGALALTLAVAPAGGAAALRLGGKADSEARLRRDVTFLASPNCEGRGPLTQGLVRAGEYVAAELKKAGLAPGAGDSYFQTFTVPVARQTGPATLVLRGPGGQVVELAEGAHFKPFGMAGSGKVSAPVVFAGHGITMPKPAYDDYAGIDVKGKVVVIVRNVPRTTSKDLPLAFRMQGGLQRKFTVAAQRGALAVLLVNDANFAGDGDDLIDFDFTATNRDQPTKLPALHVRRSVVDELLQTSANRLIDIERDIDRELKPKSFALPGWTATVEVKSKRGVQLRNVVGVLPGAGPLAKEIVVVGAHYDHLGYGRFFGSRDGGRRRAIHHGADDNGSGTTALLELARRFAAQPNRQGRRLVFIAFSGEELGLLGSRHFCEKPTVPLKDVAAMLNLDMVGRLAPDPKTGKANRLLSQGSGTAKEFKALVEPLVKKYDFHHVAQASGFGPSDHSSFCAKKVPVLFFWTGTHADYHMPSDTADKINVPGMRRVTDLAEEVAAWMVTVPKRPAFVVVKGGGVRPSKGPRLGIRPGYTEEQQGLLVEAVIDGGPGDRGGLKAGDVIVDIAGREVKNIQTYMDAMALQQGGRVIQVLVLRKGKKLPLKVPLD